MPMDDIIKSVELIRIQFEPLKQVKRTTQFGNTNANTFALSSNEKVVSADVSCTFYVEMKIVFTEFSLDGLCWLNFQLLVTEPDHDIDCHS